MRTRWKKEFRFKKLNDFHLFSTVVSLFDIFVSSVSFVSQFILNINNHRAPKLNYNTIFLGVQARAKEKEKDMQKMFSDKERTLQETQVSVAKKLGEAEHKAATLQAGK